MNLALMGEPEGGRWALRPSHGFLQLSKYVSKAKDLKRYKTADIMIKKAAWILLMTGLAAPAAADVEVQFSGSRGDNFIITNTVACTLKNSRIEIDLSPSAGGVFFDVSEASPGYGRPIPFRLWAGAEYLEDIPDVKDGDTKIVFKIKALPGGAFIRFSADTDFEKQGSGAFTNTSFVEGGLIQVSNGGEANFDEDGYAIAFVGDCFS